MSAARDEASRLISIISDSVDVNGDAVKLLQSVPSHRRITILWKGINAYVPIFNAKQSLKDRFAVAPRTHAAPQQRQVRNGPVLVFHSCRHSVAHA